MTQNLIANKNTKLMKKLKSIDLGKEIKKKAEILRKKGLSEFEIVIFLLFTLLPFFSISEE